MTQQPARRKGRVFDVTLYFAISVVLFVIGAGLGLWPVAYVGIAFFGFACWSAWRN